MDISFESRVSRSGPGYEGFDVMIKTSINAVLGTAQQQQTLDLPNGDRLRVTVEHLQADPSHVCPGITHGDPVLSGAALANHSDQAWEKWTRAVSKAAIVGSDLRMFDVLRDGLAPDHMSLFGVAVANPRSVMRMEHATVSEADDLDQGAAELHTESRAQS